jgi:type I restriction enzyme, R subunit
VPLNEQETRVKLIDPALKNRGWTEQHIRREESAGRIAIIGGKPVQARNGRTDYTLRIQVTKDAQPLALAIVEAKAEDKHPGHGLEQSKAYSRSVALNVPFVFSTNGHLFVEYSHLDGHETEPRPLSEFPTPGELWARYEEGKGFKLTDPAAKPLLTPYFGAGEHQRRYYQDAAIRAVFEKMATPEVPSRALLSLATGTGKTFVAAHLLRRLADAGQLTRALFICDRKELREQGASTIKTVFGSNAAEVKAGQPEKNARVLIATYQTLGVDREEGDASFLIEHYPENYFSHIVIDECHRSAWGKWSEVLKRNPDAFQIGLTATRREIAVPQSWLKGDVDFDLDQRLLADNIRHFGQPVYEYSLSQAMEDGFLAACDIKKRDIFLEDKALAEFETGLTKEDLAQKKLRHPVTGAALTVAEVGEKYRAQSFEKFLILPDRVKALASDLFEQLQVNGGPEQKTVVFCASDRHASDLAREMNNLYAAWCRKAGVKRKEPYAFRCTEASGGNETLPDFKGAATHHFIATTVDLITTGVDVPCIRNVVFARYLRSPITFYQMVGRGTRIDRASGKLMFRVWDYTNATRLFGEEFISAPPPSGEPGGEGGGGNVVHVEARGVKVEIVDGGHSILAEVDGRAMPVSLDDYKTRLASSLLGEAPDLTTFIDRWIDPPRREELMSHLPESGTAPEKIRLVSEMGEYDLYDVLAQIAYAKPALTRQHRAESFASGNAAWLAALEGRAESVLLALVHQFVENGTEGLELRDIFDVPEVKKAGGLEALERSGNAKALLDETKRRLFAA